MTLLSISAMVGGAAVLMFMPMSKQRLKRIGAQGLGAVLFSAGLAGSIYSLIAPVA